MRTLNEEADEWLMGDATSRRIPYSDIQVDQAFSGTWFCLDHLPEPDLAPMDTKKANRARRRDAKKHASVPEQAVDKEEARQYFLEKQEKADARSRYYRGLVEEEAEARRLLEAGELGDISVLEDIVNRAVATDIGRVWPSERCDMGDLIWPTILYEGLLLIHKNRLDERLTQCAIWNVYRNGAKTILLYDGDHTVWSGRDDQVCVVQNIALRKEDD